MGKSQCSVPVLAEAVTKTEHGHESIKAYLSSIAHIVFSEICRKVALLSHLQSGAEDGRFPNDEKSADEGRKSVYFRCQRSVTCRQISRNNQFQRITWNRVIVASKLCYPLNLTALTTQRDPTSWPLGSPLSATQLFLPSKRSITRRKEIPFRVYTEKPISLSQTWSSHACSTLCTIWFKNFLRSRVSEDLQVD